MGAGAFSRVGHNQPSVGSASPTFSERSSSTSSSNMGGVGIVFSKDQSGNFVVRTLQGGSCAAASGICPGDVIESIDGANTQGMSMRKVASAISGVVGSQVMLKIRRGTQSGNVTLERMPGFSKAVVGREHPPGSTTEDLLRSRDIETAASSSRSAENFAATSGPCSQASADLHPSVPATLPENPQHPSRQEAISAASALPSVRDEEIMALSSNSNRSEKKVSYALQDLPRLPAAVASGTDGARNVMPRPTSMSGRRLSQEFERSQLFLELKDTKSLNAIVAVDCQHLIDGLTSPDAFADARQRLIASRTRVPMADMKKVFAALVCQRCMFFTSRVDRPTCIFCSVWLPSHSRVTADLVFGRFKRLPAKPHVQRRLQQNDP